ncbi:clustered mitochondria protein [Acrasis kona]|uniref:Clustered mitochondria protein n=1 Tax=Acrasis kona TaxID=1008807 RepID=A0AAW2ZJ68_9EUKA
MTESTNTQQPQADVNGTKQDESKSEQADLPIDGPVDPSVFGEDAQESEDDGIFSINIESLTGSTFKLQIAKADSAIEIKQLLAECVETCYITSYELTVDGVKLDDYSEISDYEGIVPDAVIKMHSTLYDDKAARMHVHRTRDLLESNIEELYLSITTFEKEAKEPVPSYPSIGDAPGEPHVDLAAALNCDTEFQFGTGTEKKNKSSNKKKKGDEKQKQSSINIIESTHSEQDTRHLFPADSFSLKSMDTYLQCTTGRPLPKCVNDISMSGWNPPTGGRKLRGDLFYLQIETLEGKQHQVTATPSGFFINSTRNQQQFIPTPMGGGKQYNSQTLLGLLWEISPLFRQEFPKLLSARVKKNPFQVTPVPFPVKKWFDLPPKQVYRHSYTTEQEQRQNRDPMHHEWNEEYQSCKELASGTIEEKIIRDRTLFKIHCDFVDAATFGAKAVVDGQLLPVNPIDPQPNQVYIHNNIFYSFADDNYKKPKEEQTKSQSPLSSIKSTPTSNARPGAEGMPPIDQHAYKNSENDMRGVIAFNGADVRGVHTLTSAIVDYRGRRVIAQSIIPGILQGDQGSKHVYGSIDEGVTFSHDDKYQELIKQVCDKLHLKKHQVKDKEGAPHAIYCPGETKGIVGSDGRFYVLDLVRITPKDVNFLDQHTAIYRPELIKSYVQHLRSKDSSIDASQISFNPDAFSTFELADDEESIQKDQQAVRDVGEYLMGVVIPNFIKEVKSQELTLLDGVSLVSVLHEKGINVRYVGEICKIAAKENVQHLVDLCEREMMVRACQREFNKMLREISNHQFAHSIEHFLNALFNNYHHQQDKRASSSSHVMHITQEYLVEAMIQHSAAQYKHQLTQERIHRILPMMGTLRAFCLRVGLQIVAKDYQFATNTALINVNDILGLEPVVKHSAPQSSSAQGLLEVGRQQLLMAHMESAFDLLSQAIVMLQQVKGPMNVQVANCFSYLATILFHANDIPQAILHHYKSLIINKRVLGIDSAASCQVHQLLGMMCHNVGQSEFGLKHFLRARYLLELICGFDHPDMATIVTNISMMYQDLGDHAMSVKFLQQALRINESVLGAEHFQTGQTHHALAITYSLDREFRLAVDHERKAHKIFRLHFGDKDQRMVDSAQWLQHLTLSAVQQQHLLNQEDKSAMQTIKNLNDLIKKGALSQQESEMVQKEILQKMPQEILDMLGNDNNKQPQSSTQQTQEKKKKKKKQNK